MVEGCNRTFEVLKQAMMTLPVLALPDFAQPFLIETEASGFGLGAVLTKKRQPIAYCSHFLSARSQGKSVYEREMMEVVLAVQKWRHYLLGRKFIVVSDQRALKYLLEQREVQPQYQKWLTKLLGYDFKILYQLGLMNKEADALSRVFPQVECNMMTVPSLLNVDVIPKEVQQDTELQEIVRWLKEDGSQSHPYSIKQGMLFNKNVLVLSNTSSLIPSMLHTYHDSVMRGHSGHLRTYKRMTGEIFWKKMKTYVKKYVETYIICQRKNGIPISSRAITTVTHSRSHVARH